MDARFKNCEGINMSEEKTVEERLESIEKELAVLKAKLKEQFGSAHI